MATILNVFGYQRERGFWRFSNSKSNLWPWVLKYHFCSSILVRKHNPSMYSEERASSPGNLPQQMSKGACNLIPSCFIKGCFQTRVIFVFAKLFILSRSNMNLLTLFLCFCQDTLLKRWKKILNFHKPVFLLFTGSVILTLGWDQNMISVRRTVCLLSS